MDPVIRFIENDFYGLPPKRAQALRACASCRRRKRKCTHGHSHRSSDAPGLSARSTSSISSSSQTQYPSTKPRLNSTSHVQNETPHVDTFPSDNTAIIEEVADETGENFVGDLNPESTFLAATSPHNASSSGDDDVGIWISRRVLQELRDRPSSHTNLPSAKVHSNLSSLLLACVQQQCQQLLVPASAFSSLCRIYEQEVHPIFPVIDLPTLSARHLANNADTIIIQQAVCLAACASPRAAGYLSLPDNMGKAVKVDPGVFASHVSSAMRMSIDLGLVKDRISAVQALTVLGLFSQFSYDSDTAAETCARAISHAQTIGIHLNRPKTLKDRVYSTRLFCCVWVLDKLNAAFQGRPTLMHERDFDRTVNEAIEEQQGCFQLLLRICAYLDIVIDLYRPDTNSGPHSCENLPSFDDLMHACDTKSIHAGLLATIELLHHTVVILSCRSKPTMPSGTAIDVREKLAARSIVAIIGTEYPDQITHTPIAPYALSLSLRVLYREMRFSATSPFTRNRIRTQLLSACQVLRASFSTTFPHAMSLARLAEQTVSQMDKAYGHILEQGRISQAFSGTVEQNRQRTNVPIADMEKTMVRSPTSDRLFSEIDPVVFDGMPNVDVFEFFDADFRLDAVDAALAENMAPAFAPTLTSDLSLQFTSDTTTQNTAG